MSNLPLDALVINLPKNQDRRDFVEPQLQKLNWLNWSYFDAVYGVELSLDEIKSIIHPEISLEFGTVRENMSVADIGCAESHLRIYDQMIKRGTPRQLICEDDFKLFPTFERSVQEILASGVLDTDEPVVILFTKPHRYYTKAAEKYSDFGLFPVFTAVSTACYLINLAAAKYLAKKLRPINKPADCWRYLRTTGEIKVLSCVPHLASINNKLQSDIEEMRAARIQRKKRSGGKKGKLHKWCRKMRFNFFKLKMAGRLKKYRGPDDLYPGN